MNRRSFFRAMGIATAAVYLRIAPEKVVAVETKLMPPIWFQTPRMTMCYSAEYMAALEEIRSTGKLAGFESGFRRG